MNLHDPTPEELAEYEKWCSERPPAIAEVARRLPPWKLYRMKSTDQVVTIYAYDEDMEGETIGRVTLKVDVTGKYNFVMFERRVFGVDPDDLEETDAPSGLAGALLTEDDQVGAFIDTTLRPALLGPEEAERIRLEIAERERG